MYVPRKPPLYIALSLEELGETGLSALLEHIYVPVKRTLMIKHIIHHLHLYEYLLTQKNIIWKTPLHMRVLRYGDVYLTVTFPHQFVLMECAHCADGRTFVKHKRAHPNETNITGISFEVCQLRIHPAPCHLLV